MGSSEPMLLLWYMYHGATCALLAEKIAPVKCVAVTDIWYKAGCANPASPFAMNASITTLTMAWGMQGPVGTSWRAGLDVHF